MGAARAQRLRLAYGRIAQGLMLGFGIEHRPDQHDERTQPEPEQEHDDGAERALQNSPGFLAAALT